MNQEIVPLQWVAAALSTQKTFRQQYRKSAIVRFACIGVALISQVIGLVVAVIAGILVGSVLGGFLLS